MSTNPRRLMSKSPTRRSMARTIQKKPAEAKAKRRTNRWAPRRARKYRPWRRMMSRRPTNTVLREGLEQAIHRKEIAIESYPAYVPDTEAGEDAQAVAKMAHRVATANHVTATDRTDPIK
jgi:hypothetical protein